MLDCFSTASSAAADADLLACVRAGDERAFEQLHNRYRPELERYATRMVGAARAEDVVQETFLSAYRSLHAADARVVALRPYLYRSVHNRAIDELRRKTLPSGELLKEPANHDDPLALVTRAETLREVVSDVAGLPERQRTALLAMTMEAGTYESLAHQMGTSTSSIKALVHRARQTLRASQTTRSLRVAS